MIRMNLRAIIFIIVAGIIALTSQSLFAPGNSQVSIFIAGVVFLLGDLIFRLRNTTLLGWAKFLKSEAGGFLVFFPIWVWGLILMVFAFLPPEILQ
jgi:hypothetical protein